MMVSHTIPDLSYDKAAARMRFPAGLHQPPNSYRFGLDALLLAAFARHILRQHNKTDTQAIKVAEIGCACGATLFALALTIPDACCLGLDNVPDLIACARKNADMLGMSRTSFICANAENVTKEKSLQGWLRNCSCVLANPPWRKQGTGHAPKWSFRKAALLASDRSLAHFCHAARELLAYHAWFCCILSPELLPDFCQITGEYSLGMKLVFPVSNLPGEKASRLLLACRKEAAILPEFASPLFLRERKGQTNGWSEEALKFCPWLAGARNGEKEWNS